MSQTSVACERCRIVHSESFANQNLAEAEVGEPHEELGIDHRALYVTTDNLPDMLSDIYEGKRVPDGWKLGVLRAVSKMEVD